MLQIRDGILSEYFSFLSLNEWIYLNEFLCMPYVGNLHMNMICICHISQYNIVLIYSIVHKSTTYSYIYLVYIYIYNSGWVDVCT
jgi:hypothetical protein